MKFKVPLILVLILALSACNGGARTPAAIPTVVLGNNASTPQPNTDVTGSVTASGIVVPAQESQLALRLGGNVKAVNVSTGDEVQAGQLLVQLDDTIQQIQLDQANLALLELTSPSAIATAQQTVAQDQQDLNNAQGALNNLTGQYNNQGLIDNAQAGLVLAKNALKDAQTAYDETTGDVNRDPAKARSYQTLYAAQQNYDHALYYYNLYTGKFNKSQMDKATATLALSKARLAEDQTLVAALTGGQVPANATGVGYVKLMQAKLDVRIAQANLDATRLFAPFSGTIASVTAVLGEYVSPGQVLIVISDVNHLHVETTDLSERDVPKIKVGQTATVSIKALNQAVTGRVSTISPLANTLGGDVVYKVTIELDKFPPDLRAGMSVDVQFKTSQ